MASAETRTQVLTKIYNRDGSVTPSVLVKESKAKSAPLHDEFLWDDKRAAHEHRLWQGRHLIRTTKIIVEGGDEEVLVHVPRVVKAGDDSREGEYKPVSAVVSQPDELERAVAEVTIKIKALQEALDQLETAAHGKPRDLVQAIRDQSKVMLRTVQAIVKTSA